MSGYVFVTSPCYSCGRPFCYNPNLVPSIRIDPATRQPSPDGTQREPICRTCIDSLNAELEAHGQDPYPVREGAYEAMPEEELP